MEDKKNTEKHLINTIYEANLEVNNADISKCSEYSLMNSLIVSKQKSKKLKKETHKIYAFWVDKEKLAEWRAYIDTKGIKSEDLGLYAVQHWIDRVQPITPKEHGIYEKYLEYERKTINEDARRKNE